MDVPNNLRGRNYMLVPFKSQGTRDSRNIMTCLDKGSYGTRFNPGCALFQVCLLPQDLPEVSRLVWSLGRAYCWSQMMRWNRYLEK